MNLEGQRQPKRILMTADTIGGVWTYALELIRGLETYGIEVILATMGRPLTIQQRKEAAGLANLELRESSFKLEWMEEPWRDVQAAGNWLLDLEQCTRPDLIHLNGYAHGALAWQAPTVVVAHSCVLSWWRAVHGQEAPAEWSAYREAAREGLAAADLVIAPSRPMLEWVEELYGPLGPSAVIPNGRRLPALPTSAKERFILSAGRLWDEAKNIRALKAVAPELPWPVCLAGEERAPSQAQPSAGVTPLGRLSAGELAPWFARASIYALPARYEPFGLSALEAGLAGCALVLGDIPTLREIWEEAAVFVSPEDHESLKEALRELIESAAWRADLGAKARRAAARYTPERMAAGYRQTYRQVLNNSWKLAHYGQEVAGRMGVAA